MKKKEINLDNAMTTLCFTKKLTKIAKFGQIFGDFSYLRPRISAMMIEFVILIMWRLSAIVICCQKSENDVFSSKKCAKLGQNIPKMRIYGSLNKECSGSVGVNKWDHFCVFLTHIYIRLDPEKGFQIRWFF